MVKPEDLTNDQLLYNAIMYLFHTGKQEAAKLLLECELDQYEKRPYFEHRQSRVSMKASLSAPLNVIEALEEVTDKEYDPEYDQEVTYNRFYGQISQALKAVLRSDVVDVSFHPQLLTTTEEEWREHLRKEAVGVRVTNQAIPSPQRKRAETWQGLYFFSTVERLIAQALDRRGVMYFANCMARLGPPDSRHNKEPDFLICHNGKWGILEIDGTSYHKNTHAQDQERDRQFQNHGVKSVQHFEAIKCKQNPDAVVTEFLGLLEKTG